MYERVERPRAYEAIVTQIEKSIIEGDCQVGAQLPGERELADQFGVSRVVVREAMRYLESRGIIDVRQGSGTFVRRTPVAPALMQNLTLFLELEEASLRDHYVLRQALECLAASRAAQYATPEQIAALERILEEMAGLIEAGAYDEEAYYAYSIKDAGFHQLIAEAADNLPLLTLLSSILPLFTSGRAEIIKQSARFEQLSSTERLRKVHLEHTNIALAIRNHDPEAAEYFMRAHMQRTIAFWSAQEDHR